MRRPVVPPNGDQRTCGRGRFPAPLWDAGDRGLVLMSWPAVRWICESIEQLARALGAAMED